MTKREAKVEALRIFYAVLEQASMSGVCDEQNWSEEDALKVEKEFDALVQAAYERYKHMEWKGKP